MSQTATEQLPEEDERAVEEFKQLRLWAGPPHKPGTFLFLAMHWYVGLLTVEEGRRIETVSIPDGLR